MNRPTDPFNAIWTGNNHNGSTAETPDDRTRKPKIDVGGPWADVVIEITRLLGRSNDPVRLFERNGEIAYLAEDEKGRKLIRPATDTYIRGEIGRSVTCFTLNKKLEEVEVAPPTDVAKDIAIRGCDTLRELREKPFPPLVGIVEAPVLRPDGTIISTLGYDAATGLFYAPSVGLNVPNIPDNPTAGDVAAAVKLVNEAIGQFPFEHEVDGANAAAMLLTPIVRHIVPLVPVALIDAPAAGTGKTLLASVVHVIATGSPGVMTSVPEADDEMRKLITSALIEGRSIMLFDNLDGPLSHGSLAKGVTATTWSDRVLGLSKNATVDQRLTWIVTGNNIVVGGDMARRCYRIRLDARTQRPWDDGRTFVHPNLTEWTIDNRGRLVAALLTIARSWFAAGKPAYDVPILGSFEAWSGIVGNILSHAGIVGALSNRNDVYEGADEDGPQWEAFLTMWHERWPDRAIRSSDLVEEITINAAVRDALPDALAGMVEVHETTFERKYRIKEAGRFKIRLGKALKHRKGRRFGVDGLYLAQGENDTHAKVSTWRVLKATAGSAGSCGSVSPPTYAGKSNFSESVMGGEHSRHYTHSRNDECEPDGVMA